MSFIPSQTLVFSNASFLAESSGHLGQVGTSIPRRTIMFGGLKHTEVPRNEMVPVGQTLSLAKDQYEAHNLSPMSSQVHGVNAKSSSYLPPRSLPMTPSGTKGTSRVDYKELGFML